MSDITKMLKDILDDGVRLVKRATNGVVSATSYKLTELDSRSRRRDAIVELGEKVYAMFQAGVEMPEEALPLLTELRALDENLESMRAEREEAKTVQKLRNAEEDAQRREERAALKAERAAARQAKQEGGAAEAVVEAAEEAAEEAAPVAQEAPVEEAVAEADNEENTAAEATASDDDLLIM